MILAFGERLIVPYARARANKAVCMGLRSRKEACTACTQAAATVHVNDSALVALCFLR